MTAEVRTLALHPLAIHTFIKAQAGSLAKALSEAVMNSIDAFASTVEVRITPTGFVIEDDGQGFQSREEIQAWFETMGFPHDEGNHRLYGKFGMGRAQMWAFARTVWETNQFCMNVDVKSKGLNYELTVAPEPFKGTRITAEFYEPLSFQEQQRVEAELEGLVRYVPALVTLNDKAINKNPAEEEWDVTTPQAWMRFNKSEPYLTVYNAGLLVAHFHRHRFGCGGVVVTRPPTTLTLNLARNEILEAECAVWKALVKQFPQKESDYAKKAPDKKPKLRQHQLQALARNVKTGICTLEKALEDAPQLITSVLGRPVRLSNLVGYYSPHPVLFVPKGDEFGRLVSKLKLATVLDEGVLNNFEIATPEELKKLVKATLPPEDNTWAKRRHDCLEQSVWTKDAKSVFPELANGKKQLATSDLTEEQKAAVSAWTRALHQARRDLDKIEPGNQWLSVVFGDSADQNAWLDVSTKSFVLRASTAAEVLVKPLPEMAAFALARLKDYAIAITGDESKGTELYSRALVESGVVAHLLLNLSSHYIREARNRELALPKTRLADLDALAVE